MSSRISIKISLLSFLLIVICFQAWISFVQHESVDDHGAKEQLRKEFILSSSSSLQTSHVLWGDRTSDIKNENNNNEKKKKIQNANTNEGIDLHPLLEYVNESAGIPGPWYEPHQPDDLYLFQLLPIDTNTNRTLHPSFLLSMNTYWKHRVAFRRRELTDGLNFLEFALAIFEQTSSTEAKQSWPRLHQIFSIDTTKVTTTTPKSFPVLMQWHDGHSNNGILNCTTKCCDDPMDPSGTVSKKGRAVPVFSFLSSRSCNHRLFAPTGLILKLAFQAVNNHNWTETFLRYDQQHPWTQKIPRMVYRGPNTTVIQQRLVSPQRDQNEALFDVIIPQNDEAEYDLDHFQKYMAVLDVDTVHYPQLLCQNSILLKTSPSHCSDMFIDSSLEPFVHYIPVQPDLSDVTDRMKWVLQNPAEVQAMIAKAHEWCAWNINTTTLAHYLLTSLEDYIEQLDLYDSSSNNTDTDTHDHHVDHNHDHPSGTWKMYHDDNEYFKGHFFLPRSHAYTLPKSTVGAIKQGLRRDDTRYNETTQQLERN